MYENPKFNQNNEKILCERNSKSGMWFTVAVAAAVIIFAAPGPMEEEQAIIFLRLFCFANAVATCAMPCSFLP